MKHLLWSLAFSAVTALPVLAQETLLSPENHTIQTQNIAEECSTMTWYMLQGEQKIPIGTVQTEISKTASELSVITTVDMPQSPVKWIDSTIVNARSLKPIYHASYNMQRDMVLKFGDRVTGYYLDKQSTAKTDISEALAVSCFDSNFYPQVLRWLPLEDGYSNTMSIFDYNPAKKSGPMTATIKTTEGTVLTVNGVQTKVWKVITTDAISDNTAINTYYIDQESRQLLKQEMEFGGRKMLMERSF